jgi:hypothetical protein
MSLQEKAERAKMLVHLQESFLQMTLQEYPRFNFFEVAKKWAKGEIVQFSPSITVSSDYQFYGYDGQVLTLLTKLFANLNHRPGKVYAIISDNNRVSCYCVGFCPNREWLEEFCLSVGEIYDLEGKCPPAVINYLRVVYAKDEQGKDKNKVKIVDSRYDFVDEYTMLPFSDEGALVFPFHGIFVRYYKTGAIIY